MAVPPDNACAGAAPKVSAVTPDGTSRRHNWQPDEPALDPKRSGEVLARLLSSEVIMFVASPDHHYYKTWAARSEGEWFRIGPSMDTKALLDLLHLLTGNVAATAAEVHEKAGSDYQQYLRLAAENKPIELA
jgi:hypothetical protein